MRHIDGERLKYEEIPMLKLALLASRRGWPRLSAVLLELDLILSGLGSASRRIRREQKHRRSHPRVHVDMAMGAR